MIVFFVVFVLHTPYYILVELIFTKVNCKRSAIVPYKGEEGSPVSCLYISTIKFSYNI